MIGAVGGLVLGLIFPRHHRGHRRRSAGAGIGGLMSHHREHEIKKDVEDVLPPGTSGIVAVFDEVWVLSGEGPAKAEKIDKEKVDRDSVEQVKEVAKTASSPASPSGTFRSAGSQADPAVAVLPPRPTDHRSSRQPWI